MTLTHYFAVIYKFEVIVYFIKCYNDNVTTYSRISRFNAYYSQIKFHFEKLAICVTRILSWYLRPNGIIWFFCVAVHLEISLFISLRPYTIFNINSCYMIPKMCWIKKRRVVWVTAFVSPSHMNIYLYIYILFQRCFLQNVTRYKLHWRTLWVSPKQVP